MDIEDLSNARKQVASQLTAFVVAHAGKSKKNKTLKVKPPT